MNHTRPSNPNVKPHRRRGDGQMRGAGRSQSRRGITLLFVVSMIVLFLLMGTAFVLVSNDFNKAATRRGRSGLTFSNGSEIIDRAFYEAVVGPDLDNINAPLRGQSILGDLYGFGFKAQVSAIAPVTASGNQLYALTLAVNHPLNGNTPNSALNLRLGQNDPANYGVEPLNDGEGFYKGLVLSFTSGSARGISTRIIEYDGSAGATPYRFTVMADVGDTQNDPFGGVLVGDEIIINGPEYGGYGAGGFNPAATSGQAALGQSATLPRRIYETRNDLTQTGRYLADNVGVNESYDALDFQNMFMAGYTGNPARIVMDDNGAMMPAGWRPSFHDQALVKYNRAVPGTSPQNYMFSVDANGDDGDGDPDYVCDSDGDGEPDAVFIDIGLPVQSDESGRLFKPLVAYRIEDMGGKVNLNAVGSQAQIDNAITTTVVAYEPALSTSNNPPLGQGLGPAEINPIGLFGSATYSQLLVGNASVTGRYGLDTGSTTVPGINGQDYWSRHKLFGYPRGASNVFGGSYGTLGYKFGSALDIHGRFSMVVTHPVADPNYEWPDPNFPAFPNGQPGINMLVSSYADEIANNPYEKDFARSPGGGTGDRFFTTQELERLLRRNDRDTYSLPSRLWDLGSSGTGIFGAEPRVAGSVTTDSYEITRGAVGIFLKSALASRLAGSTDPVVFGPFLPDAAEMLGPEINAGLLLNVNRAWGNGFDNNGNLIVDEIDEMTAVEVNTDQDMYATQYGAAATNMNGVGPLSRAVFAKNLYVLTLLTCDDGVDLDGNGTVSLAETNEFRTRIAQWVVNVVDFRDADSVFTPFEFDLNPFNGWDVDLDLTTDEGVADRGVVWGIERPELLITETMAGHDTRTEDDGSGNMENRLIPNAYAFVELYNPWTQNSMSQTYASELYGADGVDITAKAGGTTTGSPVWRISVCKPRGDEQSVRAIYMATDPVTDPTIGSAIQFLPRDVPPVTEIPPGWTCVIGPQGVDTGTDRPFTTVIGRRSDIFPADEGSAGGLDLPNTKHIALNPDDNEIRILTTNDEADEITYTSKSVIVDSTRASLLRRGFNISDRRNGYPGRDASGNAPMNIDDGISFIDPHPAVDEGRVDTFEFTQPELDAIAAGNSNLANFRIMKLQRLANPMVDFDVDTNPYITVDRMSVNLHCYNGLETSLGGSDVSSFERGENDAAANQKSLWGTPGVQGVAATLPDADHYVDNALVTSLGAINETYRNSAFTGPFAVLNWNNRPYASHLELMNVPYVSGEELNSLYTRARDSGPFANLYVVDPDNAGLFLGGRFGHLLNFFGADGAGATTNRRADLFRLMDYLEVPSRFAGTETFLNGNNFADNPFNYIPQYRQPGKINLNTIPNELVWNALMGQYAGYVPFTGGPNNFITARNGTTTAMIPTDVQVPFRPAEAANWVPALSPLLGDPNELVVEPINTGLFRQGPSGIRPLFDVTNGGYDSARNPALRNHMTQRLGNMTTNRSSVFSIWITVGYFEIDPQDGSIVGEIGEFEGEQVRHRGFYLFDRSVPVAFEPGRRHNVDRAILVQSIIED